jgi:hypothetical protein
MTRAYANGTELTTCLLFHFVDFLFLYVFLREVLLRVKFVAVLSVIGLRTNK